MTQLYSRRRVLISGFQYRLLMANLAHSGTIVLIFVVVIFLPLMLQLRSGDTRSPMEAQGLADEFLVLHARLWPALFLVLFLLALHSVVISHRVAGPLYRFRSVFRAVAEGDLSVWVRIRKADYLTEEADLMNEMIAALGQRILRIEAPSTAILAGVGDLKRALEGGSGEGIDEAFDKLDVQLAHLRTSLGQFRIAARGVDGLSPSSVSAGAHGPAKSE